MIAVAIDEALALRLLADDLRLSGGDKGKAAGIRPDQRYASDGDYADDVDGEG